MSFNAVVFPGQGAQKNGMAKDFIETYSESSDIFSTANQILPFDVYDICHEDNELLNQTNYTQPCILTAEIAMFQALKAHHQLNADYFAGHSLGEYAALVAAEVLPFESALKIVARRGELMNQADDQGAMAAIIMDNIDLDAIGAIADRHNIDIANDNSAQQVVLSGRQGDLDKTIEALTNQFDGQSFRAVPLTVSAAFHSRYMAPVEKEFYTFLQDHLDDINESNLPKVASNYLGDFYQADKQQLIESLAKQISGTVKWRDNMNLLKDRQILELGPNRPLRGFFKTIGVDITSVINLKSAQKAFNQ
ncbi:ACP S-malonyltransferase [Marinicella gelatinilytica]|uniref:ACP S-malonyltransferase n=1 Tax=Marinicella gelatinilytica TaxID=2996017 RepID=UPI002260ABE5|nr:ACP S-malonyltransferase [Marinicella gelatinilytica]MCX7544019.1 ACP S-malonyltransferase [Marinicella gelatinilytica]